MIGFYREIDDCLNGLETHYLVKSGYLQGTSQPMQGSIDALGLYSIIFFSSTKAFTSYVGLRGRMASAEPNP